MAAVVVFCTTYALILPAITQEKEPTCGKEVHEHDDSCYGIGAGILECAAQAHIHGPECQDEQGFVICGNPQYMVHTHEEHCYDAEGALVCPLPEVTEHQHTDLCYAMPEAGVETTQAETQPIHEHGEACYVSETVVICGQEETEGHQHGEACADADGNLICGEEELPGHIHDDNCLEETARLICEIPENTQPAQTEPVQPVLICGYETAVVHRHEGDCFVADPEAEQVLLCELEEHIHDDLLCYVDLNADLELEHNWLRTIPELTGHWTEDILAVAESQLGYLESTRNYVVEEDGSVKGYTRYGQWYGYPYGDWCAMFASFCLHYAQIPGEVMPLEASCPRWIKLLEEKEIYLPAAESITKEGEYLFAGGDPVFFDYNGDGIADHVGLVAYVEDGFLHTIEGNKGNSVCRQKYELTNPILLGYGLVPDQPEEDVETELILTEQTIQAVIYTDGTLEQPAEDATVILISGMLPEGAVAVAYPVVLESNLIEGETILLAYDITILDAQGNPFEQTATENPFRVSIQPPDWEPAEDAEYNVYYIPEEGDPQIVESENEENVVLFDTDHFSTYALTTPGTLDTVYLNGASGNDTRAGNSTSNAVKTMNRALELVKDGGTIYITGTVTVSEDTQWDLEDSGVVVKRNSSFTGPLITVANGGSLTLKNINIHGGSGTPSSSNIATNTTYATNSAKAPLIVVQSGGSLNICDGAVLEYNSNKPDSVSTSGYLGQGGAVYCQGNLNMTGGTIRYCEALSGGGIYIESANTSRITFNLSGGTITYNYAREIVGTNSRSGTYHRNAGGGVYVGDYVTMNMSGGTISYNQSAREGGGISLGWLNRKRGAAINNFITTLNMTGGTLDNNIATSTGGGLNITAGREAYISAGYFTNNTANGLEYQPESGTLGYVYSGGGIYLDAQQLDSNGKYAGKPGYALIHRVLITNNTSPQYCGGIATCSTSNAYISPSLQMDGTLIFGNRTGSKTAANSSQLSLSGTVKLVGDTALGGIDYNWDKSYRNALSESDAKVKAAMKLATVIITGNDAFDGGGIGCNGTIEIGGEEKPTDITVSLTKVWDDDGTIQHPDYVTVQVYQDGQPYGDPIRIWKQIDASGNEYWPTVYVDSLPSGHEYTIRELEADQYSVTISKDGYNFTITNSVRGFTVVKKWVDEPDSKRPESITVQLLQNGVAYGESVQLTAANGWKYTWLNLPEGHEYTAEEVYIPKGYYSLGDGELIETDVWQITNIKIPMTSVSVEKRWEGGGPLDSVIVDLLSNGVKAGEVTLSAANNWFHEWENLPKLNEQGKEITYWVKEQAVSGFESKVVPGTPPSTNVLRWEEVSPKSGETYLIVSSEGALTVSGGELDWDNLSEILASGEDAPSAALWTWNDSLKNGNGVYLYLSRVKNNSYGSSYTYYFNVGTTTQDITLSQGRIYGSLNNSTRYLTGIDNSGRGTTDTKSTSAMSFKFYKQSTATVTIESDHHFIVTNTKLPDSIRFKFGKYAKGASEEPTLLAGAVLELYKVTADGDVTIPGTGEKGTLLKSWTSENASGDNGGIHVEDLFSGTYYLIETQTPPGHLGLSGPIIFEVIAESGTVNVISCPYELTLSGGPEVEFPIYNTVTYTLPETGGSGTVLYTAGGLLLMLASAVLLLNTHSKRRRGSYDYL